MRTGTCGERDANRLTGGHRRVQARNQLQNGCWRVRVPGRRLCQNGKSHSRLPRCAAKRDTGALARRRESQLRRRDMRCERVTRGSGALWFGRVQGVGRKSEGAQSHSPLTLQRRRGHGPVTAYLSSGGRRPRVAGGRSRQPRRTTGRPRGPPRLPPQTATPHPGAGAPDAHGGGGCCGRRRAEGGVRLSAASQALRFVMRAPPPRAPRASSGWRRLREQGRAARDRSCGGGGRDEPGVGAREGWGTVPHLRPRLHKVACRRVQQR